MNAGTEGLRDKRTAALEMREQAWAWEDDIAEEARKYVPRISDAAARRRARVGWWLRVAALALLFYAVTYMGVKTGEAAIAWIDEGAWQ